MVTLVNRIIEEAVRNRASDIHIEPMPDRVVLRYRIDGVCTVRDNLPKRMQAAVLARLKLMSGINIAEKRIPQDGRIKLKVDESQIDFRVSSCPAYHGESIVLRILRPDSVQIGLANLGFEPDHLDIFNRVIRRPNGIFLVTGPTGSGKPPPCTPHLTNSTGPTRRSLPLKIRWNTTSKASTSARSERASASPLPPFCDPCFVRRRMSFWLVRFETVKSLKSRSRLLSPATWSSQPCTPMTRERDHPIDRYGRQAFLGRQFDSSNHGPATGAGSLQTVQGAHARARS